MTARGVGPVPDRVGTSASLDFSAREAQLAAHVREILALLGEDPDRAGLIGTPGRVAKSLRALTSGYMLDLAEVVNGALYEDHYNELVLIRDVEFYSLCEHHMLPFFGRAHVAYRPVGRIVGLSKIPRILEMYARQLQVQERLTRETAEAVRAATASPAVGVVVEAEHMCIAMRGVAKPRNVTVTSCLLGDFETYPELRDELLAALQPGRNDGSYDRKR